LWLFLKNQIVTVFFAGNRCHWHRTARDPGRPYHFISAWKLLEDYFNEVERILGELGITYDVVSDSKDEK
jgi:hypothetical protein